jgi:hypothetical protein
MHLLVWAALNTLQAKDLTLQPALKAFMSPTRAALKHTWTLLLAMFKSCLTQRHQPWVKLKLANSNRWQ